MLPEYRPFEKNKDEIFAQSSFTLPSTRTAGFEWKERRGLVYLLVLLLMRR
jgi:hypothetical protein